MSLSQRAYNDLWQTPLALPLTGAGCVVGMIDQPLWRKNPLYKKNIMQSLYRDVGGKQSKGRSSHGASVVSICAGQLGVARKAKILYQAIHYAQEFKDENTLMRDLFLMHAQAMENLRDHVRSGGRLDCISTSYGWPFSRVGGFAERNRELCERNIQLAGWFEARNIPVFHTGPEALPFFLAGRNGLCGFMQERMARASDPAAFSDFERRKGCGIPIDDRYLAAYAPAVAKSVGGLFYKNKEGGSSWAAPFVAGLFALARQADPSISRDTFVKTLIQTAQQIEFAPDVVYPMVHIRAFSDHMRAVSRQLTPHAT